MEVSETVRAARLRPKRPIGRGRWRLLAALPFLLASTAPGGAQEFSSRALAQARDGSQSSQMAAQCQAWHAKALAGGWFTEQEKKAYDATDRDQEELSRLPACRSFFGLSTKCQELWVSFVGDEPAADAKKKARLATQAFSAIETTPGCRSILGGQACDVIEHLPPPLSKSHKAMLSDCADENVRNARASLVRPAL